ncbi:VPA1262 family N-terminal domain-containing protein [Hyphomicrobium sp. 2TAF46]|uniref:VPA1262 family N-terminal domain-containing protein n=1 Tax=Hyphomicrobium sp. 2TAF46 TaxID=3233019 RepID=UPI003F8F3BFF
MNTPTARHDSTAELARLLVPSVLGFATHFEATEIVAFRTGEAAPINVFSIFVAEELDGETETAVTFLNGRNRIELKSLKGWKFGVARYRLKAAKLSTAFDHLRSTRQWKPSGEILRVGMLEGLPPVFVPADTYMGVPWNQVLKNNFWSGSYVLEWADKVKADLQPLYEDPLRLRELSAAVQPYVPLGLASFADRLGNVAVQIPASIVMATVSRADEELCLELAWHPLATPRPLRVSFEMEHDRTVCGFGSAAVTEPCTVVPIQTRRGILRAHLWDDAHRLLLWSLGESAFINTIGFHTTLGEPEPRSFIVTGDNGVRHEERVRLVTPSIDAAIGDKQGDDNGGRTHWRIYRHEVERLASERRFVQYRPEPGEVPVERRKAIADLRLLINQYGKTGTWLWDPYLNANDILQTLFYSKFSGADLRALTAAESVPGSGATRTDFVAEQRAVLEAAAGNRRGLRLEYRARVGQAGWGFHDRFLIFPGTERGAFAWSLGTSVNSVGTDHHILQRVDDGQLVADAFIELWDQLDAPEHQVWKSS